MLVHKGCRAAEIESGDVRVHEVIPHVGDHLRDDAVAGGLRRREARRELRSGQARRNHFVNEGRVGSSRGSACGMDVRVTARRGSGNCDNNQAFDGCERDARQR
jgi:hypothetical protein